jgi:general secretion pathway protein D
MFSRNSLGWLFAAFVAVTPNTKAQQTPAANANQTSVPATSQQPSPAQPSAASTTPPSSSGLQSEDDQTSSDTASLSNRRKAEKIYLEGAKSLEHKDIRKATEDFEKAHELDPSNMRYKAAAEIGKQHLVTELVQQAEKAKILGHNDESRAKLEEALKLDPNNRIAAQHIDELAGQLVARHAELRTETDAAAPPIQLTPAIARHSFHLRTSEQDLIRQVLNTYGVLATLDSSVKNQPVRLDVDEVDFAQATKMLKLVTNTFIVPLDPLRALVALDTKENRSKYERQVMETVYLHGLTATELTDMGSVARNVFGAEHTTISAAQSAMIVRAPESQLNAFNATLQEMLDGHSEVQLDVRLYEIDKTRTTDIGVILPTSTTVFNIPSELNSIISSNQSLVNQIISSGLANAGDFEAIAAILIAGGQASGVLSQPFGFFGGGLTLSGLTVGGGTANLLLNSSNTRAIDQMQLRALDQEEQTIRSGTRYPIITSTYSGLSGSSVSIPGLSTPGLSSTLAGLGINASSLASNTSQTIPQVQYQDIGLTLKVTPHVQQDRSISLKLSLKLVSLQGSSVNSIPILNNREYEAITTLRAGETATVVSAVSKQESSAVTGIPGLDELPGFEGGTNQNNTRDISELVIVITPRILRLAHNNAAGSVVMLPLHP